MNDFDQGFAAGIQRAREIVASQSLKYENRGILGAATQEAFTDVDAILAAALSPPPARPIEPC